MTTNFITYSFIKNCQNAFEQDSNWSLWSSCRKGQKLTLRPNQVFNAKLAQKGQKATSYTVAKPKISRPRAKKLYSLERLWPRAIKKGQIWLIWPCVRTNGNTGKQPVNNDRGSQKKRRTATAGYQSTRHTVNSSHARLFHTVNSSRYRGSGVDLGGTGGPPPSPQKIGEGQRRYCSGCTDPERWWAGRRVFFLGAKLPF